METSYRYYEEKDFNDFREMVFCLYEEDPDGQIIDEEKIRKTVNESKTYPEKLRIVMICADGTTIGYSLICFTWSNEYGGDILNIDELYIRKEYRNNSMASGFINHQMWAHENVVAIAVETTPSNAAAGRLYHRLGFKDSPNDHLIFTRDHS